MIAREQILDWLHALEQGAMIGVDESGLTLATGAGDAYLEVGGIPDEDENEAS